MPNLGKKIFFLLRKKIRKIMLNLQAFDNQVITN